MHISIANSKKINLVYNPDFLKKTLELLVSLV